MAGAVSEQQTMKLGIIGAGNIAGPYLRDLPHYPELELLGIADLIPARAEALAAQYQTRAYPSVEALLADPAVEMAVNLTVQHAHPAVTTAALQAGKHVYSEKPLATRYADAVGLVDDAVVGGDDAEERGEAEGDEEGGVEDPDVPLQGGASECERYSSQRPRRAEQVGQRARYAALGASAAFVSAGRSATCQSLSLISQMMNALNASGNDISIAAMEIRR